MSDYEQQYLGLCKKILDEGVWVKNERTGRKCLTIPEHTLWYDGQDLPPLLTTKRSFPVSAWAEMLGYLRRYEWADLFDKIGSVTWYCNANETKCWLENPNRLGNNHIGKVYGAALAEWELPQLFEKLMNHEDDRRLMINFWRTEKFEFGCLPPCMYKHSFTIIGETLHMCSESRSLDVGLGGNFNSLQCYLLLVFFLKFLD
jgi:thymidylate synthase